MDERRSVASPPPASFATSLAKRASGAHSPQPRRGKIAVVHAGQTSRGPRQLQEFQRFREGGAVSASTAASVVFNLPFRDG
jgi:hypothetical protein